jgi:hypothetical protein
MQTKFKIGEVIAVGLRIWARNLIPFLALTAVMESPVIIWGVVVSQGDIYYGSDDFRRLVWFEGITFVTLPLRASVLSALLTYGVVMELQGRHVSIYTCIATGLSRMFSAIGTMVLACLCLLGTYFAGAIPGTIVDPKVGVVTGTLLALTIGAMLFVAPQAAVIDRNGMREALGRSRALTRGHRVALLGLLLLLLALAFGVRLATNRIVWNLASLITSELASMVVVGSIIATMPCVAYYYLRAEKEGSSAEELASVFD